ncbi:MULTISPECIES: hypothetical protein [unclassified Mesorhizobium]|uniref:hypothetical protein n=1 Tax=unclassified Mesorhizobium TaxID=325217 RepID=UPI003336D16B
MADEFAAADAAVDQTVDKVTFERRAATPDEIKKRKSFPICFCPVLKRLTSVIRQA